MEQNDEEYNVEVLYSNTQKYIDVVPSMVEKYNNTCHRSIKLTPSDARNPTSYQHVHNALYAKIQKATPKFHVGDLQSLVSTRLVRL